MFSFIQNLVEVIIIDIVMSGDNAVVIGLAVAGIAQEERRKVIVFGIGAATVLRISLALIAVPLLKLVGLTLAGGLLLLWVGFEFWRELTNTEKETRTPKEAKSTWAAFTQIVIADASMSLDNVLGVAGAAREHPVVIVIGLVISILLMAFASTQIAKVITKHKWIAYVGLAVILYVALSMIVTGGLQIEHAL